MQNDRKLKISVANNRKSKKWITQEILWSEFVKKISTPVKTNETYEQFIRLKKIQQDELKDCGGFVRRSAKRRKT